MSCEQKLAFVVRRFACESPVAKAVTKESAEGYKCSFASTAVAAISALNAATVSCLCFSYSAPMWMVSFFANSRRSASVAPSVGWEFNDLCLGLAASPRHAFPLDERGFQLLKRWM